MQPGAGQLQFITPHREQTQSKSLSFVTEQSDFDPLPEIHTLTEKCQDSAIVEAALKNDHDHGSGLSVTWFRIKFYGAWLVSLKAPVTRMTFDRILCRKYDKTWFSYRTHDCKHLLIRIIRAYLQLSNLKLFIVLVKFDNHQIFIKYISLETEHNSNWFYECVWFMNIISCKLELFVLYKEHRNVGTPPKSNILLLIGSISKIKIPFPTKYMISVFPIPVLFSSCSGSLRYLLGALGWWIGRTIVNC